MFPFVQQCELRVYVCATISSNAKSCLTFMGKQTRAFLFGWVYNFIVLNCDVILCEDALTIPFNLWGNSLHMIFCGIFSFIVALMENVWKHFFVI